MKIYASYGFKDFILCLGHKGDVIRNYFLNYMALNTDFTINLKNSKVTYHDAEKPDWNVTLVDTGEDVQTGARVKRAERFIGSDTFMLTYGDAVSDVDICQLLAFHKRHGKMATVTGVFPAYKSRFGEVSTKGESVTRFAEKPINSAHLTSGGFFVLEKEVFKRLSDDENCVFEKEPLASIVQDKELCLYEHKGFWHCMDTPRDLIFLNALWDSGNIPWLHEGQSCGDNWKDALDVSY